MEAPAKQQSPVILQLKDCRLPSKAAIEWRIEKASARFAGTQRLGIFDIHAEHQDLSTVVVTEDGISQKFSFKHVHAHSPGEHYEHRHGDHVAVAHEARLGDFEFHLVHTADDGAYLVISVLLKVSEAAQYDADNFLGTFVRNFKSIPGEDTSKTKSIDLEKMISELRQLKEVTTYKGTLTTPLHDSNHPDEYLGFGRRVRFVILDSNVIPISEEQLHYCRFQQGDRARRAVAIEKVDYQKEPIFAEPSGKVFDCGLHGEIISVDRSRPETAAVTLQVSQAAEPLPKKSKL